MAGGKRSNRKAKVVRDPSAYATVSVRSTRDDPVAPEPAVAEKEEAVVDPPTAEAISEAEEEVTQSHNAAWVSLDLAQRQAATRLSLEASLKARLPSTSPTIRVSEYSENTLVGRMRSGELPLPEAPSEVVGEREWTRAANFVYETLVQYGFHPLDLERAMMAARGSGDIVDALTWLCVHVPTEHMPADMRDKHEFSHRGRPKAVEEEEKVAVPVAPVAPVAPSARIDQASDTEDLAVSLADLGLEDDDDDGSESDEEPSACHARVVLRLRGFEEWVEYLQGNNAGKRHSGRIRALRGRIVRAKRVLGQLEADLLFNASVSLATCERVWPEYHDALLDDIRRFREQDAGAADEMTVVAVDKPPPQKRNAPADESNTDSLPDSDDDDDDGSVIGFGAALDDEDWGPSTETPVTTSNAPQIIDTSAVPRGWTGAAPRDLLLAAVLGHDRHATVKYQASQCAYGHTCTVVVTWSQPSKQLAALRTIPGDAPPPAQALGPVTQAWTVPHTLVVGATARDARDLAVLAYLYTQEPRGARLAPPLADLWGAWEAQQRADKERAHMQRVAERAAFLAKLRAEYEQRATPRDAHRVAEGPETAVPRAGRDSAAALRMRLWGAQTVDARRGTAAWRQR
ncbi:hypothetical protein GGI24_002280, partial [Coemansia furcata]